MSLQTKEVCVCDECGIERNNDTNHWWLIFDPEKNYCSPRVSFMPWSDVLAADAGKHLCGLTCLYKTIDKLAQEILRQEVKA